MRGSPEGGEIIKPGIRFSAQKHVPANSGQDGGEEGP